MVPNNLDGKAIKTSLSNKFRFIVWYFKYLVLEIPYDKSVTLLTSIHSSHKANIITQIVNSYKCDETTSVLLIGLILADTNHYSDLYLPVIDFTSSQFHP